MTSTRPPVGTGDGDVPGAARRTATRHPFGRQGNLLAVGDHASDGPRSPDRGTGSARVIRWKPNHHWYEKGSSGASRSGRECGRSGFDSAEVALLTWFTPRTPEDLRRTGRAPLHGSRFCCDRPERAGGAGRPRGLTPRNQPSNVARAAPRGTGRFGVVRICSLRTQQRAESQCQSFTPWQGFWLARPGWLGFLSGIPLIK